MIKEISVKLKLNAKTIKHYWLIGYSGTTNDIIDINVSDLTKGSHVKITAICDRCKSEVVIPYKSYLKNIKKYNFYSCIKCCDEKKVISNIKKFGTERATQNKDILKKIENTNIKKYGSRYYILTDDFLNNEDIIRKRKNTRLKMGYDIPDEKLNDWEIYKKIVRNETTKHKKDLMLLWEGYDYYDNEYIKDNLTSFKPRTSNYPTIDHKISIKYGFDNNIDPIVISEFNNLCITKGKHNCSKRNFCKEEYINKINKL